MTSIYGEQTGLKEKARTSKIEHDGGIRIDVSRLPLILKGERIPE